MTPGTRTHRQASLRVVPADGLPEDMRADVREIVDVQSGSPREGHATALMHQVCSEADFAWVTLLIMVKPFAEGMNCEQLKKWYGKFGFVEIQAEPCLMARSPVKPQIVRAH